MSGILTYLRSFRQLASTSESDGVLLQRFRMQRDEQAFAMLVQRHGPLVLGIARRALGPIDAADDVFQATFLVLAQRGKKLETWPSVAGWLVQVARRTALQARAKSGRRSRHEQQAADMNTASSPAPDELANQRDLAEVLDAELARLPSKYRTPLVLCQLQGQTKEETAQQLGWPVGSVSGRLARGKKLLQERLLRRGLVPSIVVGAFSVPRLDAQVSNLLIQSTTLLASNVVHQTSKVSAGAAVTLAQGVMTSMFLTKLKYAAVVIVMLGLCLGTGAWAWSGREESNVVHPPEPENKAKPESILKQLQGLWVLNKAERPIESIIFNQLLQRYWRFNLDDLETFDQEKGSYRRWSMKINESLTPASIELDRMVGVVNLQGNNLLISFELRQGDLDKPVWCAAVLRRATDYDRLEGIWRKEERNPVTNELNEVDELIFRNNYFVRRKYIPTGTGTIGLSNEYAPSKFELHESLHPKGIDLDIMSEADYRKSGAYMKMLKERVLAERALGIYQLTDKELKYVITGRVPYDVQGDHLIPNPRSPDAVRGISFEKTDKPVQIYKRFEKSLKDEMSANGRMAYPPQQAKEQPPQVQAPVSQQIQTLRQQRLKLAKQRMELWKQAQAAGAPSGSIEELGPISQQVLDASIALATDIPAKVRAMEEHLQALKQIEQYAEAAYQSGSKTQTDLLAVQLRRIEFEIQLEEMKAKR